MYHASVPCPAHDLRLLAFSCTTTLVPGSTIGVALKSKLPCNVAYADRDGLRLADRNRLIVMLHCGNRRSHSLAGKLGSQVCNPAIK
jgi:hypothetical protein